MFYYQTKVMRSLLFLFSVFYSVILLGQDVNFNQVNMSNLYSNPALTGVNGERKFSSAYKNQSPSITGGLYSIYGSYQDGSSSFGNFGAYYMNTLYSNGVYNSHRLGLNYAKPIKVTNNLTFTPAISSSVILDQVDFSKITFGDLSNPRTGRIYDIYNPLDIKENAYSVDFSGGLLVNWKNIFGSISFNQFGSIGEKSIFNTYSNIGISLSGKNHDFTLIPEISLNTIQNFHSVAIKMSGFYKWAKLGVEYNHRNNFSAIVGARLAKFDVSISTEWINSQLNGISGLSFEAGLSYTISMSKYNKPLYNYSLF
jgi:hypothetical protein